ncbi:hypothetical protein ZWY2020_019516 [Hordeum vulgare]|nr:hypothetical protein ZWY2020_019516 [Hordeum vulgare]
MAAALGAAATLLGKVFTMLSAVPVAAYVDSLELGHNSQQIRAKLAHTRGLLHNAQASDVGHNPGLQDLLPALSRDADQAEDLLDELHYFQIHDRLHATHYATTQQANFLRHGRNALRHTATSWAACFSCSSAQDDSDSTSSDGDELRFHPVVFSRKIKSVLQDMQTHCDSVSDLLGNIPNNSLAVALHRPQTVSTILQATSYGRRDIFEETVDRITTVTDRWRGGSDLLEDFSHLENLHDFRVESELHSNIRNVGKMKHLQRLKEFHVKKESMGFELTELGALTELEGELIIRGLELVATKEEATAAKLMLKKNLKELELFWRRDGPTTDADILDALQPHPNLRVLTIANQGGTVGPSWLCLDIWFVE